MPRRILQVIHGYPMRYNAGSEVYTQTLSHELARRHEVHVFTREEDPFAPDARLRREQDLLASGITLHLVNNPRHRDRYRVESIDRRFEEVLDRVHPEVVHFGHLNHLSTSLVEVASRRNLPIVFTLHDYWLMCPRGQFMQMFPEDPADLWPACEGQEDRRCAERCYARYFGGDPAGRDQDVATWTRWVHQRMTHLREVSRKVDRFLCPSRYLLERYRRDFQIPEEKLTYLDYGFDRSRLAGRRRVPDEPFTFGYIGTHIPAKGIHQLIQAFGQLRGETRLRIWGRPRDQQTASLKALAASLPHGRSDAIEWLPEYRNQDIVGEVFDRVDAIVVPSIWVENSPLVIHEAQQARVPVITADVGGMAEYVHHEVNGLLFEFRNPVSLSEQMQRFLEDPSLARRLGERGYLFSGDGQIPNIGTHVRDIEEVYEGLIRERPTGPWRITFDTNPDTCNLHCVMCEEHSPLRKRSDQSGTAPRRPRRMPIELVRHTVREGAAHGLREIIPSTMGEPLLYTHFEEILEICQEHQVLLNLTTNGTFPRLGAEEWSRRLVPRCSDIKVSLNGSTPETQAALMPGADLEKVLANLRILLAAREAHAADSGHRCTVTLQLTFQERNLREIADLVRLGIELGVDRIKGHHLWAHFPELEEQSLRRSPEAAARWNQIVRECCRLAGESQGALRLENFHFLPEDEGRPTRAEGACPFLGKEAWVNWQGRLDPCCAPDAQRGTLGSFGNLEASSLMEIWQSAEYQDLRANYQEHPLCGSCLLRRPAGSRS